VAGVLVVLVVTRTLPKDTAGIFFALTSVFLIAETIARLGTGTGLVYAISRTRALDSPGRAPAFVRVALTPVVVLSIVLGGTMLLTADALAGLFPGAPSGAVGTAIRVLAVLLPLTTISDTVISATRGHGTIVPTVVLDGVGRPVIQLIAVTLAVTSGSLAALSAAWAAPWAVCALLAGWWLLRLQRPAGRPGLAALAPEPRPWREFWSFTGPRAATSVVQLALQRLDIVLLSLLAGPIQAALYTAATRFLVVGQFANQALSSVVEPRLSRLLALSDRPAANAVYQTATGWLVLLCWPLYLLVCTYADRFLAVFGNGYDAGAPVVLVLATTMLVATSIGMVDVVLIMGGRTRWNLVNAVTALAVNVGVDLVLIPRLGLLGAATGWALAILVKNLLPLAQVWRVMGLHPFGRGTGTAVVLSLVCFGAIPQIPRIGSGGGLAPLIAATVAGGICYAVGCWRWREVLALDTLRGLRRERAIRGS
jgi:O-antigen/teichoic acid export membrane protein